MYKWHNPRQKNTCFYAYNEQKQRSQQKSHLHRLFYLAHLMGEVCTSILVWWIKKVENKLS